MRGLEAAFGIASLPNSPMFWISWVLECGVTTGTPPDIIAVRYGHTRQLVKGWRG